MKKKQQSSKVIYRTSFPTVSPMNNEHLELQNCKPSAKCFKQWKCECWHQQAWCQSWPPANLTALEAQGEHWLFQVGLDNRSRVVQVHAWK